MKYVSTNILNKLEVQNSKEHFWSVIKILENKEYSFIWILMNK